MLLPSRLYAKPIIPLLEGAKQIWLVFYGNACLQEHPDLWSPLGELLRQHAMMGLGGIVSPSICLGQCEACGIQKAFCNFYQQTFEVMSRLWKWCDFYTTRLWGHWTLKSFVCLFLPLPWAIKSSTLQLQRKNDPRNRQIMNKRDLRFWLLQNKLMIMMPWYHSWVRAGSFL